MKLSIPNPANTEEAHIAEVFEEIARLVFDVMPAEWKLVNGRGIVVGGIDNAHIRRDNRVA